MENEPRAWSRIRGKTCSTSCQRNALMWNFPASSSNLGLHTQQRHCSSVSPKLLSTSIFIPSTSSRSAMNVSEDRVLSLRAVRGCTHILPERYLDDTGFGKHLPISKVMFLLSQRVGELYHIFVSDHPKFCLVPHVCGETETQRASSFHTATEKVTTHLEKQSRE